MAYSTLDESFGSVFEPGYRPCVVATSVASGAMAYPPARRNLFSTFAPPVNPYGVPLLTYPELVTGQFRQPVISQLPCDVDTTYMPAFMPIRPTVVRMVRIVGLGE